MHQTIRILITCFVSMNSCGNIIQAQELRAVSSRKSDPLVLEQLFGKTHLDSNVRVICKTAKALPDEERYEFLARWVLPGETHTGIRLLGEFRSPASAVNPSENDLLGRLLQGHEIDSPVLQLVDAAQIAGRLEELQERIQSVPAADNTRAREKLTLLFLVSLARNDFDEARRVFDRFVEVSWDVDRSKLEACWSEFLIFWSGIRPPATRSMVGAFYFNLYRDPLSSDSNSRLGVVRDYIRLLQGVYQHVELHKSFQLPASVTDVRSQWIPCSLETAASRGMGRPRALWDLDSGQAFRITGHDTDFLTFRVPLRGNFQVECDAYAGSSPALSLMVAGTYAEMTDSLSTILTGTFGAPPREVALDLPLSKFREVVRLRATVRDGVLTHYINGRPVVVKQLPANHDPWVAIRTGDRSLGVIRDLRITGEPQIPSELKLITSPELEGWSGYYESDRSGWRANQNQSGDWEIQSSRRSDLAGSFAENLLRYHRPIVEDGSIEYEFFYRTGESCVHPALGRFAFLLSPQNLRVHKLTDGSYDRSELSPGNAIPVVRTQREIQPLPLIENDWNRLRLSLAGDKLELILNGRSIHTQTLNPDDGRELGLFHYRDQTQARVRAIVWRAGWANALPPVPQQQLASGALEFLDDSLPKMTSVFEHDFATHKDPFSQFTMSYGAPENFRQSAEGMHVSNPPGPGYTNSAISPKLRLSGNFDISARFENLDPRAAEGANGGVILDFTVDNDTSDQFRIMRRFERVKSTPQSYIRCMEVKKHSGDKSVRPFTLDVEESLSGTLRLSRRGKDVYLLFAEGDSPNYRLFGKHTTTTDDVIDINLIAHSYLNCVTEVLWKSLQVRAEGIESFTEEALAEDLKHLNAERELLPKTFTREFATDPFEPELFALEGVVPVPGKAIELQRTGTPKWSAARFISRFGIRGDFDVEVELEDLELVLPEGKQTSAIYLQTELADGNNTRLSLILAKNSDGSRVIYMQDWSIGEQAGEYSKNRYEKRILKETDQINALRISRRGRQFYFLYRLDGSDQSHILVTREYSDRLVRRNGLLMMLNSGAVDQTSRAKLKSLRVHADGFFPEPEELLPRVEKDPPSEAPNLLEKLLNRIKSEQPPE